VERGKPDDLYRTVESDPQGEPAGQGVKDAGESECRLIMRRIGPVPNLKGCPLPAGEDSREPLEWLNDLEALDSHMMAEAQVGGPCVHKPTPSLIS
jgi:hypothetical protein